MCFQAVPGYLISIDHAVVAQHARHADAIVREDAGTPTRLSVLPDVPTFTELGFPQLEATGWIGLFAASDVPPAAQQRLREATLKVLQQPQLRERFKDLGQEVGQPLTSNEMSASLRKDSARVGEVLHSVNYKPE